eukprot:TRINITY_DN3259_c0_g1_i14.p1 TRINITY_DN3259_c0_g1~~TRINITY_DN3259_c0_g1_i14.p1  ORF type:complete len:213 (+),score=41.42 TRINITY_DN3259_c0_g1_i14:536-1174(+)
MSRSRSTLKKPKKTDKAVATIRSLLKYEGNKRCMECNERGPQYVCLNYDIFVCTNCAGLHSNMTHRVKSIGMASFTDEEVDRLKVGGNEFAKAAYLATFDQKKYSLPDPRNTEQLVDFMNAKYKLKKWYQEPTEEEFEENARVSWSQSRHFSGCLSASSTIACQTYPLFVSLSVDKCPVFSPDWVWGALFPHPNSADLHPSDSFHHDQRIRY